MADSSEIPLADSSDFPIPDSDERLPPPPPSRPAPVLPRLTYPDASKSMEAGSEQEGQGSRKSEKKERVRKESRAVDREDKPKASKLEETPTLDTYETRQRVRLLVGSVLGIVVFMTGWGVYRALSTAERVVDLPDEGKLAQQPTANEFDPAKNNLEASQMFSQARLVAQNGNPKGAISLLEKIKTAYPQTPAAKEAGDALERPKQGLPMFVDGPAVVAKAPDATPRPVEPPVPVVDAVPPTPSAPSKAEASTDVQIVRPANPPEPRQPGTALVSSANVAARPLPAGFKARPEAGVHATGWPLEIVGDRDGATMVLVPGGTFTMGRDDGPPAEAPAHQVQLGTYYIDQHEVTARQYARFQQESGKKFDGKSVARDNGSPEPSENQPVVKITAREALEYARWAGKGLPTEAQWEMAARTPDGRIHPWGPDSPNWQRPRASKQIDPVMSFPADLSPYGAYDLAGNAWEWTMDWYDPTYFQQFKTGIANNPIGPIQSKAKPPQVTVKGGSRQWQSAWREGVKVDARLAYVGFRCALTVDAQTGQAPGETSPSPAPPGANPAGANNGLVPF